MTPFHFSTSPAAHFSPVSAREFGEKGGNSPLSVRRRARAHAPARPTLHAAFSSALLLQVRNHWRKNLFLHFSSLPPAHARALIDAMGDAAAAAASTSAPTTPTSILICLEDGSDLLADADDGAGTDLVVARDERLLVVDQDEEYVALLLSKESASGGGSPVEEMEDWMKAARSGCVRWIIKVVSALFLLRHFFCFFLLMVISSFFGARRLRRCSGSAGRPLTWP
jgi:hypothetical protein